MNKQFLILLSILIFSINIDTLYSQTDLQLKFDGEWRLEKTYIISINKFKNLQQSKTAEFVIF